MTLHSLAKFLNRKELVRLLCVIDVEEIGVQDCLNYSCNDGNGVVELRHIEEVAIDPIRDVQCPVCAECKKIMCRNCFGLAGTLEHKQLREDRDRLEPNGECP